jgi:hypothetical protein
MFYDRFGVACFANCVRYLEDLREHMHNLKDLEPDAKSRKEHKKVQKWIDQKRRHLRVLVKYLDKDYALTKKR